MKQGTYEDKECVYVIPDIFDSVFIDLADQVVELCPSRPFWLHSYAMHSVHFILRATLCILFIYCVYKSAMLTDLLSWIIRCFYFSDFNLINNSIARRFDYWIGYGTSVLGRRG